MILSERKVWAYYRRVSELLLSPNRGMTQDEVKLYAKVQRPEKQVSFWEEGWSSLPEGEWAVAESQRMRRLTTRQTKEIEQESINILFSAT